MISPRGASVPTSRPPPRMKDVSRAERTRAPMRVVTTLDPSERARRAARLESALATLGRLHVDHDALEDALARAAARRGLALDSGSVDSLPPFLADFCLVCACLQRPPNEDAWRRLIELSRQDLLRAAAELYDAEPDSAVQSFYGDLWVARSSGSGLLHTYMGLAPLRAWLQLVFRRRTLAGRDRRASVPWREDREGAHAGSDHDLARAELRQSARSLIDAQLRGLSSRDRALLEARVIENELGVHTARRLGVSPAYVSRRFKELLGILRGRILPGLQRHGYEPEDLT